MERKSITKAIQYTDLYINQMEEYQYNIYNQIIQKQFRSRKINIEEEEETNDNINDNNIDDESKISFFFYVRS